MFVRKLVLPLFVATLVSLWGALAFAAEYKVDPGHSFIEFRIKHLGYSWLYGRFDTISGEFGHDPAKPESSRFSIEVETASINTNHAERDKHLRSKDFLDVKKFPKSIFKSMSFTGDAKGGVIEGELILHGVKKKISINVEKVGEGKDPWGGYRAGFIGKTTLSLKDFGITYNLGPASKTMEFELGIEGTKK
ncbi:MAG: YceI family protein [Proteobacteria bacterium]|nr:YceI family protein [Pseudomonadota bacterium]